MLCSIHDEQLGAPDPRQRRLVVRRQRPLADDAAKDGDAAKADKPADSAQ